MQEKRLERKILITNKLGLHARASAKFVDFTSRCKSKFLVKKGRNTVNGSSLLGLMTLAASKGTEIKIQCIGQNAEEDLQRLINLIKNNFGEEKPLPGNLIKEKIFRGIAVSYGFVVGNCAIKKSSDLSYSKYNIPTSEVKNEIERLDKAVKNSVSDLAKIIKKIKDHKNDIYDEMKFLLEANILIISSSSLVSDAKKRIHSDLINAEFAIIEELNKHSKIFKKIKDDYLKDRFDDVRDVCRRILENLQKKKRKQKLIRDNQILISNELSAADLLSLSKTKLSGLVSVMGGPEGHFAIVARSLSIPTLVGVKNILKDLKDNEPIILDGEKGILIKNPKLSTINYYKKKIEDQKSVDKKLKFLKKKTPLTSDNIRVRIEANIDNSDEAKEAMKIGIDGIGLLRSEYMFMDKKRMPSEKEQFYFIKKTLNHLKGKPLTIRTLDVGNDKKIPFIQKFLAKSRNPALGLRAIRLTLAFPKIFKRQISAILRASKFGKIRIMLPMVSNVSEILEAKKLINDVSKELSLKKKNFNRRNIKIGVLIETPAAALISESLAKNCDFLAIGTNDLTMYTLAIDRGDEEVAKIYDPAHLSVLRLIKLSSDSAKKVGVPISVCGEMAGDTMFTSLLLGMGIKTLSMSISRILKVKQFITKIDSEEVSKICSEIFKEHDNLLIKNKLKVYYDKIYNELNRV
ncbi:MAG: phosphoenolpyruvate--protein phosphotransferase [Rickettsiales bacterium]|nr:phosphoenolpyruvate--protein phosphotransferase [Rickettsiales bacterium]RPG14866.1 MAG: phosphoenolpyruvate--protein phosphotransferase [Pelagibacteraceae bacterium TMED195]